MFGFFKSPPFDHPNLGTLTRSDGYWRGKINIESIGMVNILLTGNRSKPDNMAITPAAEFSRVYPSVIQMIETSLYEHYLPYRDAIMNGEFEGNFDSLMEIKSPKDIWPHVEIQHILFKKLSGTMTTEIAYTTSWDIEHTLGARLVNGKFLELCGSI